MAHWLEILVEEESAAAALAIWLHRLRTEHPDALSCQIRKFDGKPDLLKKLPGRLKGYAFSEGLRILVLLDRDNDDCLDLKRRLLEEARRAGMASADKLLFRIAIEELEAWFLGDETALCSAYPGLRPFAAKKQYRNPEAIAGGTWESLERLLQQAGYYPGGLPKIELARKVAPFMNLQSGANRAHSFDVFLDGLRRLLRP